MVLADFFQLHPKAALAFSGGTDSSYLLYAAVRCGADIRAYYVKTAFQPQFELEDANRIAALTGAQPVIIDADILRDDITQNNNDRCYHCKKLMLQTVLEQAHNDGYDILLDGTNASDSANDRAGMRALCELSVLSPLKECGMTKAEIRRLSKEAGLFTWDKPAYACLATRIPTGEAITKQKLTVTERAEDFLFSLGFTDFRIRFIEKAARIQLPSSQLEKLMAKRDTIVTELKKYYSDVLLDLEARNG